MSSDTTIPLGNCGITDSVVRAGMTLYPCYNNINIQKIENGYLVNRNGYMYIAQTKEELLQYLD